MNLQRHIIKRQTVQVSVPNQNDAHQLQQQMSRIYRTRLVPIIDKHFSRLSESDVVHRIDSLDVHLGTFELDDLEEQLVTEFSRRLPDMLSERIRDAESRATDANGTSIEAAAQMELFVHFARTGSLPWWADASRTGLPNKALNYLVQHVPQQLKQQMRELASDQRSLRRTIQHFDDQLLAKLFLVLLPASRRDLTELHFALLTHLPHLEVATDSSLTEIRKVIWHALLFTSALRSEHTQSSLAFAREVFLQIAGRWRVDYAALLLALKRVLSTGQVIDDHVPLGDSPFGTIVEALHRETVGRQSAGAHATAEQLVTLLDRLQRAGGPPATLCALLCPVVDRLSVQDVAAWLSALSQLERHTTDREGLLPETLKAIVGLLRLLLESRVLSSTSVRQCQAELKTLASDAPPKTLSDLPQMPRRSAQQEAMMREETQVEHRISEADEQYVGNAGVVVLWPFLGRFLQHLGLSDGKQFNDESAVHRATGLLGYLAKQDPSPAEYRLPLCKVLCGMPMKDVFEFGSPVSAEEAEQCENLLQAAIVQVPILGNMSIDGFRGSFLIRQGILSTRDGGWLLRVERETYDVVLDRFPWGIDWVNLPWMRTPLRVEWTS